MSMKRALLAGLGVTALASCAAPNQPVGDEGRTLTGTAPAGTNQIVAVDADGLSFAAVPAADGAFSLKIDSTRPISLFLTGTTIKVLKMSASPGAPAAETLIPDWNGTVTTAQMSTCDCDEDGADDADAAVAEENPLEQIDTDEDGDADFDDADDDDDGEADDEDGDRDGSGEDDDGERHDDDHDGRPNMCDDDDDNDGELDEADADHERDSDHDGVGDDHDGDDDNDGEHDEDDNDDDGDGTDDENDGDHDGRDGDDTDPADGEGEGEGADDGSAP